VRIWYWPAPLSTDLYGIVDRGVLTVPDSIGFAAIVRTAFEGDGWIGRMLSVNRISRMKIVLMISIFISPCMRQRLMAVCCENIQIEGSAALTALQTFVSPHLVSCFEESSDHASRLIHVIEYTRECMKIFVLATMPSQLLYKQMNRH
jgi:hypothetical protein